MKAIELTQGKFALVDDEDFEYLNQFKWKYDSSIGYACRTLYPKGKEYIHKVIHPTIGEFQTDHINRNKLDNRKSNLRTVTLIENLRNVGITKNNTSGFKGVSLRKDRNMWEAYLWKNYKKISFGLFRNLQDVILARKQGEEVYWI